ncbi:MAG: AAA family ATPase, partial [Acidimicrobiia bacterium]|nr:AAA family ATPase [Acidimicrobiia bacterium]
MDVAENRSKLVNRVEELDSLERHRLAAHAGQPRLVLLGGEAGIGKTRLLREFAGSIAGEVLWGSCLPMTERGLPYVPFIEMLRSLDREAVVAWPSVLNTLLPSPENGTPDRATSRSHLFQGIVDLFETLADKGPIAIVIEDLHWADRSTTDLLTFLLALLRDQRILIVATFRSTDLVPGHPLLAVLHEWTRRPNVHTMELEPLKPGDAKTLVLERLAGTRQTNDQINAVVERAGGNPFFLEELTTSSTMGATYSGPLRQLLLGRAQSLPEKGLKLLRIASVAGVTVDELAISQIAALSLDDTRDLLRAAVDAQLLVVDPEGCRFRHTLLAEALAHDLLPAERRQYHAAYADLLEGSAPSAALATHQAGAGRPAAALVSWIEAARVAESQFAFAEALDCYDAALACWDEVDSPAQLVGAQRIGLQRRQAETAFVAGYLERAVDIAEVVISAVDAEADPLTAGLVHDRLARYLCSTPRYKEALSVQKRAVDLVPDLPSPERAQVLAGMAWILQYEGQYHEARRFAARALEMAKDSGSKRTEISSMNTLGNVICVVEDLDLGLSMMSHALNGAIELGDGFEQMRGHWNIWANLIYAGEWKQSLEASRILVDTLPRLGFEHDLPEVIERDAAVMMKIGKWDEAGDAVTAARQLDPARGATIGLPMLHIARGEFAEAQEVISAKSELSVAGLAEMHLWNSVHRAELEAAMGKPELALGTIDQVLAESKGFDRHIAVATAVTTGIRIAADGARAAREAGDADGLTRALGTVERFEARMGELALKPGPANGWKRE